MSDDDNSQSNIYLAQKKKKIRYHFYVMALVEKLFQTLLK